MGVICKAIQMVGYGVALVWAIVDELVCGVGIAAAVGVGHPAMSHLSIALIALHRRTMSVAEQKALAKRGEVAGIQAAPAAWRVISRACAAGYVLFCVSAVWYFVGG
jgi:hypothetical protein